MARIDDDMFAIGRDAAPSGWGLDGSLSVVVGASEGIGAATALMLARAGSTVVVGGRDVGRLEPTLTAITREGLAAHAMVVDARDPGGIRAFAEAVATIGSPDVLVNSMGGTLKKAALDVAPDEWNDVADTHLRGTFFLCQAFARPMAERGRGSMINLSSTSGFLAPVGRAVYSSVKAGINHLTAALAAEWGPLGIRVNAVAPGTTLTPRARRTLATFPEREQYLLERIPLGRIAEADDVARAVCYLASPASDYITGQTLPVDGGWTTTKSAGG